MKTSANDIISLIPENLLDCLTMETRVDYQVKHLSGKRMFKLILYSMINSQKLSLRVMESYLSSAQFKHFSGDRDFGSKYNSIRDRICTIDPVYFERLFKSIFTIYNKELKEEESLSKVDSTHVSLASSLLKTGMTTSSENKRQIKFSLQLKGSLPSCVKVYTSNSYLSENIALSDIIHSQENLKGNIVVFDRGLQSRDSFDKITTDNKRFISRINLNVKYKVAFQREVESKPEASSVTIEEDIVAYLYNQDGKQSQHEYRIIKAICNQSGNPIYFVSNLLDEDAYLLAGLYKQRWDIEVFFKFLKQHLNLNHLVSRNENGIKVMVYMTMILAILIMVYKKNNHIKGFKIAKLKFEIELENEIIKTIVELCGGDPLKAKHLFSP